MKKGVSEIEWAISLGLFLVYIAWFFVYAKPLLYPTPTQLSEQELIIAFEQEFLDETSVYGAIIKDNKINQSIIITGENIWSLRALYTKNHFVQIGLNEFYFKSHTNEKIIDLSTVGGRTKYPTNMIANATTVKTDNFQVKLNNYFPQQITYFNYGIEKFNISFNGINFNPVQLGFNFQNEFAYYISQDYYQTINYTSLVIDSNPMIYNVLKTSTTKTAKLIYELDSYNDWYTNSLLQGSNQECSIHEDNFIRIEGSKNIHFCFEDNITINICNNTLIFSDNTNFTRSQIWIKSEKMNSCPEYGIIGGRRSEVVLLGTGIDEIMKASYDNFRKKYAIKYDFNVDVIVNNTIVAVMGDTPPLTNIFAASRQYDYVNGTDFSNAKIIYRYWR